MSSGAVETFEGSPAWRRLESGVRTLTADREAWRQRALAAEDRVRDLEGALRDVTAGRLDPVAVAERARQLEAENRSLRRRLDQARETVDRIVARLQFTQEEP